jgi:hypothetical protein
MGCEIFDTYTQFLQNAPYGMLLGQQEFVNRNMQRMKETLTKVYWHLHAVDPQRTKELKRHVEKYHRTVKERNSTVPQSGRALASFTLRTSDIPAPQRTEFEAGLRAFSWELLRESPYGTVDNTLRKVNVKRLYDLEVTWPDTQTVGEAITSLQNTWFYFTHFTSDKVANTIDMLHQSLEKVKGERYSVAQSALITVDSVSKDATVRILTALYREAQHYDPRLSLPSSR